MTKGKLPRLLLAVLASASLTLSMVGCDDKDKSDDPLPTNNSSNVSTCTDLDVSKLTGKQWYKVGSNGTSWIIFNTDGTWDSQQVPYSSVDTKGDWKKDYDCIIMMNSKKDNSQNIQPIKVISIGNDEVTIANRMDFSNKITYKTTP
jgi:hypothetical protein